jgi:hypothetical protein
VSARIASLTLVASALAAGAGCPGRGRGPDKPVAATDGLSLTYYIERRTPAPVDPGMPPPQPADEVVDKVVVVEQRRWVEVGADRALEIDRIDDGADLESLVIESLQGGDLALGTCGRDSVLDALHSSQSTWLGRKAEITLAKGRTATGTITAIVDNRVILVGDDGETTEVTTTNWRSFRVLGGDSLVRCKVTAGEGKHLVRVVYTTGALGFHADHTMRVSLDETDRGKVEITPRFTVDTPPWQVVADVSLYDGMPGGTRAPREVFRGPITLTGDAVVVAGPTQTAVARIEAVYRGAIVSPGESSREAYWRTSSNVDVWDWLDLELGDATLPPGRLDLEIARATQPVPEPAVVEQTAIELPDPDDPGHVRIRLWPVNELRGQRLKMQLSTLQSEITESILFSLSNAGERTREVVVEEELRPAKKRSVLRSFPRKPTVRDNILRVRLKAIPGNAARAGVVMHYEW